MQVTAADRKKHAGVDRRPLWLCYRLVLVGQSELDVDAIGFHAPHGFQFDPTRKHHLLYVAPTAEEQAKYKYPELRLTAEEHQLWEWLLLKKLQYYHDEMHVGGGLADHIRNACMANALFNNSKVAGKVEFTLLWCRAGEFYLSNHL